MRMFFFAAQKTVKNSRLTMFRTLKAFAEESLKAKLKLFMSLLDQRGRSQLALYHESYSSS